MEEQSRLETKIVKVREYWGRASLLIPNVFRHLCNVEPETRFLLEFQDLSCKIVLVQGTSAKSHFEDADTKATTTKKSRDRRPHAKHRKGMPPDRAPKKRAKRSPLSAN